MKTIFTIFAFYFSLYVFPQEQIEYFDIALNSRAVEYSKSQELAFSQRDFERADFLFDSLFKNHLYKTYVPNIKLSLPKGKFLNTDIVSTPFVLITKSASMFQFKDEIDIINSLAEKFSDQIKFIVIYWGSEDKVSKLAKSYNKIVSVTYLDERSNNHNNLLTSFKHVFGVPACFFVSSEKQITNIDRSFNLVSKILNINSIEETNTNLASLLFNKNTVSDGKLTTNDDEDLNESSY